MQDTQNILDQTMRYVSEKLSADSSGHDWQHVSRVWRMAKEIQQHEGGNLLVIELAALLHDIADWKFTGGDHDAGPKLAAQWLGQLNVDSSVIDAVVVIIHEVSFRGAGVPTVPTTLEGKIVQDADRLDAIGAVGVARTFAYDGHKGHAMWDPNIPPQKHDSFEAYKTAKSTTVNHFYEKLLLLKDLMNTPYAKKIARQRHMFMEQFLTQLLTELNAPTPA